MGSGLTKRAVDLTACAAKLKSLSAQITPRSVRHIAHRQTTNANRWADALPAERYFMDFLYRVAERLIAHVICITPFLLWWGIASLVSWRKEVAAQQYVRLTCGILPVSGHYSPPKRTPSPKGRCPRPTISADRYAASFLHFYGLDFYEY